MSSASSSTSSIEDDKDHNKLMPDLMEHENSQILLRNLYQETYLKRLEMMNNVAAAVNNSNSFPFFNLSPDNLNSHFQKNKSSMSNFNKNENNDLANQSFLNALKSFSCLTANLNVTLPLPGGGQVPLQPPQHPPPTSTAHLFPNYQDHHYEHQLWQHHHHLLSNAKIMNDNESSPTSSSSTSSSTNFNNNNNNKQIINSTSSSTTTKTSPSYGLNLMKHHPNESSNQSIFTPNSFRPSNMFALNSNHNRKYRFYN